MMQSQTKSDYFCFLKLRFFSLASNGRKVRLIQKRRNWVFCFLFSPYYLFSIKFNDQWSFVGHLTLAKPKTVESGKKQIHSLTLKREASRSLHCSKLRDWAMLWTVMEAQQGIPHCSSPVGPSQSPTLHNGAKITYWVNRSRCGE